jgi:hypothetical protein
MASLSPTQPAKGSTTEGTLIEAAPSEENCML